MQQDGFIAATDVPEFEEEGMSDDSVDSQRNCIVKIHFVWNFETVFRTANDVLAPSFTFRQGHNTITHLNNKK